MLTVSIAKAIANFDDLITKLQKDGKNIYITRNGEIILVIRKYKEPKNGRRSGKSKKCPQPETRSKAGNK